MVMVMTIMMIMIMMHPDHGDECPLLHRKQGKREKEETLGRRRTSGGVFKR